MVAADAGVLAALGVVEAISFLFVNEEFDSFVQAGLVGFERQHVIGLLVDDLGGDLALAAHGVESDNGAVDGQHVQQIGDGDDLVRLFGSVSV